MSISDVNEIISIAIVLVLYLITFLYVSINLKMQKKILVLLFLAIVARIIFSILDMYYLHNFLPHSGSDSVIFERTGYYLATGVLDIASYSWDNYPRFIYLVYSIIGRQPFVIIGINGVLSILTAFFLYKSISLLTKDGKKAFLGMTIFLLFPHSVIFSSIILRESMIVFFVTISIYIFVKYTREKKVKQIVFSVITLLMASYFHAGVVFLGLGYLYYFLKEKRDSSHLGLIKKPIVILLLITVLIGAFTYSDAFFRKFSSIGSIEAFVERVERGTNNLSGSAYLQGYDVNSFKEVLIYAPLKLIYFFFSPIPWDIRNINDIIAFALDSIIYLYLFKQLVKKIKRVKWKDSNNQLFISLLIGILIVGVAFALGTANAGTALRHRYKLITLIILAIYTPIKEKFGKNTIKSKSTYCHTVRSKNVG